MSLSEPSSSNSFEQPIEQSPRGMTSASSSRSSCCNLSKYDSECDQTVSDSDHHLARSEEHIGSTTAEHVCSLCKMYGTNKRTSLISPESSSTQTAGIQQEELTSSPSNQLIEVIHNQTSADDDKVDEKLTTSSPDYTDLNFVCSVRRPVKSSNLEMMFKEKEAINRRTFQTMRNAVENARSNDFNSNYGIVPTARRKINDPMEVSRNIKKTSPFSLPLNLEEKK